MKTIVLVWMALITLPLVFCGALFAIFLGATHPDWVVGALEKHSARIDQNYS